MAGDVGIKRMQRLLSGAGVLAIGGNKLCEEMCCRHLRADERLKHPWITMTLWDSQQEKESRMVWTRGFYGPHGVSAKATLKRLKLVWRAGPFQQPIVELEVAEAAIATLLAEGWTEPQSRARQASGQSPPK